MRRFIHTSVLIGVFLLNGPTVKTYNVAISRYPEKILPELTLENLYDELIWSGVKHPDIVFKQAALETMWLKCSDCSLKFNNLFGFRTTRAYLKFDHWTESVRYYKKWQDTYYKGGNYYNFLINIHYASATNYIGALKTMDKGLIHGVMENSTTWWE